MALTVRGPDASEVIRIRPPRDASGLYFLDQKGTFGPDQSDWHYPSDTGHQLFSKFLSGAHPLPNGNVFITEGNSGRFLEVTQAGHTVWEYISPLATHGPVAQGEVVNNPFIFRATKYPASYLAFKDRALLQQNRLELMPFSDTCMITSSNHQPDTQHARVTLRNTLVDGHLFIDNPSATPLHMAIFDISGDLVLTSYASENIVQINLSHIDAGCYVINIHDLQNRSISTLRFIRL